MKELITVTLIIQYFDRIGCVRMVEKYMKIIHQVVSTIHFQLYCTCYHSHSTTCCINSSVRAYEQGSMSPSIGSHLQDI